jgi:hypothetical protein
MMSMTMTCRLNMDVTSFFLAQTHKKAVDADLDRIPERRKANHHKTDTGYQPHIQHTLADHSLCADTYNAVWDPDPGLT